MPEFVNVDRIAEAFRVSSRQVQRFAIYEGMPREKRGLYDFEKCLDWYIKFLHAQVCGCGPGRCDGFDRESRDVANRRAERAAALRGIIELSGKLAGKKAGEIRERLSEAIAAVYGEEN
jgi:hypothetical protein